MMLRLAWHCSGTYCKTAQNGGSDGATMRFKPECDHGRLIFDLILDSLDNVKNYYTFLTKIQNRINKRNFNGNSTTSQFLYGSENSWVVVVFSIQIFWTVVVFAI